MVRVGGSRGTGVLKGERLYLEIASTIRHRMIRAKDELVNCVADKEFS